MWVIKSQATEIKHYYCQHAHLRQWVFSSYATRSKTCRCNKYMSLSIESLVYRNVINRHFFNALTNNDINYPLFATIELNTGIVPLCQIIVCNFGRSLSCVKCHGLVLSPSLSILAGWLLVRLRWRVWRVRRYQRVTQLSQVVRASLKIQKFAPWWKAPTS